MKGEKLDRYQQEDNKILTVYNLIASYSHGLRISLKLINTDDNGNFHNCRTRAKNEKFDDVVQN